MASADPLDCSKSDAKMKVLCADVDLMATAIYVDIRYLSAMEKATNIQEWLAISGKKLHWLSIWSTCYVPEIVGRCVNDAILESDKLFPFVSKIPNWEELQEKVKAKAWPMLEASKEAVRACAVEKALALDDGVSPAADIAVGVSNACKPFTFNQVSVAASSYGVESVYKPSFMGWQEQSAMSQRLSNPSAYVGLVLEVRASRRAKALQAVPPPSQRKPQKQPRKMEL